MHKKLIKPNFVWAFLFVLVFTPWVRADFYSEQIEPLQQRAFDSSSRHLLGAGLLSVGLASSQDNSVRDQYRDHRTLSSESSQWGDRFGTYLVGPAIALGQLYWDHDNGEAHVRALVSSAIVTHLLKETVKRRRPDSSNRQSMPSGHSSTAFATATSLTYAYGLKAAVVAYPVATFVAVSRMADDVHWFSDVVAGAFIGAWMGRASSFSKDKPQSSHKDRDFFVPVLNPSARIYGIVWERSF